jgi:hypothetical protein
VLQSAYSAEFQLRKAECWRRLCGSDEVQKVEEEEAAIKVKDEGQDEEGPGHYSWGNEGLEQDIVSIDVVFVWKLKEYGKTL